MRSTAVNSPLTRPWQGPLRRLQSGVAALARRAQLFALQKKNRSEKVAPAVEAVGASRCSSVTSIYEVQMVPQPEQQVASSGGMSPVANSALALPPVGGGGLSPSATLPASGPAPALLQPLRPETLPGNPGWEQVRNDWLNLLNDDPNGIIYLHPDLVLSMKGADDDVPVVLAGPGNSQERDRFGSLAVLRSTKSGRVGLSGLPLRLAMKERKLVSNRVLGGNDEESLLPCIRTIRELLASGEADRILFEDVELGSPLRNVLARAQDHGVAVLYPSDPQPHWWIRFPDSPDDYWKKFSGR